MKFYVLLLAFYVLLVNSEKNTDFKSPRYNQSSPWIYNTASYSKWDQPCVKSASKGPICRIYFLDDSFALRNANCIEDNVFLIKREDRKITRKNTRDPFQESSYWNVRTKLRNQTYVEYLHDDKPPPNVRLECKSRFALDFQFAGVGALDHAMVSMSKAHFPGNVTYSITMAANLAPEATGKYIFYSLENTNMSTSFFIFSESLEKPYLLGGRRTLHASTVNGTFTRIPCVSTDPTVNVTLFKKSINGSFLEILETDDGFKSYDPKQGFLLNSTMQIDTKDEYRCFTGTDSPATSTEYVTVKSESFNPRVQGLYIEIHNQSAVCYSNHSNITTSMTFTNVASRNPSEMKTFISCLQRDHEHCGRGFSDTRREGQPGIQCPNNSTSCLWITDLHDYGFVYCEAEDNIEPIWKGYFTGFDNITYTDYRAAPSSALVNLKWDGYPNKLTAGNLVYMRCTTVGMLFMGTEYPFLVKLKNGTTYEPRQTSRKYSWVRVYDLLEEMKEVICINTLWNNTANISASVEIDVQPKPRAPRVLCNYYQFACKDGNGCASTSSKCDGHNDCTDGSDEQNCSSCSYLAFKCVGNRTCINGYKKCNHVIDCPDGSDEASSVCQAVTCSSTSTRCRTGHCITLNKLCDGKTDCLDKSDEDEAYCSKHYPRFDQNATEVTFAHGVYNHLICSVVQNEFGLNSTIKWWRRGFVLEDPRRIWINHSGSKVKLSFENTSTADAGEYTCVATNQLKSIAQTYEVTIEPIPMANSENDSGSTRGVGVALAIVVILAFVVLFGMVILFGRKLLQHRNVHRSRQLVNNEAVSMNNVSTNGLM